jgi:glycosyltransferase involved in cell wall biosynthesis
VSVPTITVVTPCLDSAATMGQTLDSVAAQLAAGDEHLVIDGGSTDGTVGLLEGREGVRFISEPDRGLSDAMNKGIRLAQGDVVGWLNADDMLLPGALDEIRRAFGDNPGAQWATGICTIIDGQGREIRKPVTAYKRGLLKRYSFPSLLVQNFVMSPATYVRRQAYEAVGGFDERFRYSMDYDVWLKLGRRSDPVVLDRPLAAFRMAEGSLSMSGFERQFEEHLQNAREHGEGHRIAVALNALMSRAFVLIYRGLRLRRRMRNR